MNKTLHCYYRSLVLVGFLFLSVSAGAQESERSGVAIKTNLLYDATSTFNLGMEFRLSRRLSLDVSGNYNPFQFSSNKQWRHWLVQPELRVWPGRALHGHFLALHGVGGAYNVGGVWLPYGFLSGTHSNRYSGWAVGGGVGYGYRFDIGKGWGLELEAGAGYVRTHYDRYECRTCGDRTGSGVKGYVGPTKVAISVVYRFARRKPRRVVAPVMVVHDTIFRRDTVVHQVFVEADRLHAGADSASFDLRLSYRQGSPVVYRDFDNNAGRLAGLSEFIRRQEDASGVQIQRVRVTGYSSPEGFTPTNDLLSRQRADAVAAYLRQYYPDMNEKITAAWGGEDWVGLMKLIAAAPQLPYRDEVEHIIRTVSVTNGREWLLLRLRGGVPYAWMKEHLFPQLRRVEIEVVK